MVAAGWYSPMIIGGLLLAVGGGLILHLLPSRALLIISSLGFLCSVMLFAIVPIPSEKDTSTTFLYWAYIFPAMCCATLGIDVTFNVMNIFITTALPKRDQAAVGALTNTVIYLGGSFWLGISELVIASTQKAKKGNYPLAEQYRTGFWLGVALSGFALCTVVTVQMGKAEAELTADEKEARERLEKQRALERSPSL